VFFGKPVSEEFGLLGLCGNFLKRDDSKIGGVDCYVLTGHLKASRHIPISLWIGKEDLLIHQIQRTTMAGAQFNAATRKPDVHTEIHENIVVNQTLTKENFAR